MILSWCKTTWLWDFQSYICMLSSVCLALKPISVIFSFVPFQRTSARKSWTLRFQWRVLILLSKKKQISLHKAFFWLWSTLFVTKLNTRHTGEKLFFWFRPTLFVAKSKTHVFREEKITHLKWYPSLKPRSSTFTLPGLQQDCYKVNYFLFQLLPVFIYTVTVAFPQVNNSKS